MKGKWLEKNLPIIVGSFLNTIGIFFPDYTAKKALDIFCKPRKGRLKPFHKTYLDTIDQTTLYLNDIPIQTYHIDKKANTTLLLAHGWESNAARWKRLINFLNDLPINIVMLDAPAHGQSGSDYFTGLIYADMINEVVKHYRPNLVIGHSVGAFSITAFLNQYDGLDITDFIILASPDNMADIMEKYFSIIGLSERVKKAFYKNFPKWYGKEFDQFSAAEYMNNSNINGIIIHDINDDINEFYNAEAISKAWKNAKLIPTEGLNHGLQHKRVYQMVFDYINQYLETNSTKD